MLAYEVHLYLFMDQYQVPALPIWWPCLPAQNSSAPGPSRPTIPAPPIPGPGPGSVRTTSHGPEAETPGRLSPPPYIINAPSKNFPSKPSCQI